MIIEGLAVAALVFIAALLYRIADRLEKLNKRLEDYGVGADTYNGLEFVRDELRNIEVTLYEDN